MRLERFDSGRVANLELEAADLEVQDFAKIIGGLAAASLPDVRSVGNKLAYWYNYEYQSSLFLEPHQAKIVLAETTSRLHAEEALQDRHGMAHTITAIDADVGVLSYLFANVDASTDAINAGKSVGWKLVHLMRQPGMLQR